MSCDTSVVNPGWTYYGPTRTIPATPKESVLWEGAEVKFIDPDAGLMSYGRIMRNASSITMYGGRSVRNVAAYRNKRFDGYTSTIGLPSGGVIDPLLATLGVRVGDLCVVFYKGPCKVKLNENPGEVVAAGDWAKAMTNAASTTALTGAGKVLLVAAANTAPGPRLGVFMEAATTADGTGGTMKLVDLAIEQA